MRKSNWTPSIVPNRNDQTVYLVAADFGRHGRDGRHGCRICRRLGRGYMVDRDVVVAAMTTQMRRENERGRSGF